MSNTYIATSPVLGRQLFSVHTNDTWALRAHIRERIGRRRSARLRYRQIGTNSFVVERAVGWPVMYVYKEREV